MKNTLFSSFTALFLIANATPLVAQEITPINLVYQGYQGYFTKSGIPSYGAFIQAIHFQKVDAEALVKSAIAQEKLSPKVRTDDSYLRKVKSSLLKIRLAR
jgi:hypothetical protein